MGMKYIIDGFNYPWRGIIEAQRQTQFWFIAAFWFAVYSIKYDGVNITKRQ
jgi:hypothetical protein